MRNIKLVMQELCPHVKRGTDMGLNKEDIEDIIQDCYVALLSCGACLENLPVNSIDNIIESAINAVILSNHCNQQDTNISMFSALKHDKLIYDSFSKAETRIAIKELLQSVLTVEQFNVAYPYYIQNVPVEDLVNTKIYIPRRLWNAPAIIRQQYVEDQLTSVMKIFRSESFILQLEDILDISTVHQFDEAGNIRK